MRFYKVREEILKGKNIADLPLKVTFYARVSTESDEQLNALDNQISFFEKFIKLNKNWTYVNGYIDEGISGSTVKRRKKFLQMIDDAKSCYFDLIVTKEVSDFLEIYLIVSNIHKNYLLMMLVYIFNQME